MSYILFVVFLYVLFGRKKNEKRPAHGLSKSLPFFARATACEHSVERRLPLVSAVPISGTKELASRTPIIVWHTRSNTFVLIPLLELTRAVAQTVPDFFLTLPFVRGFSISYPLRVLPLKILRGRVFLVLFVLTSPLFEVSTSIGNSLNDGTVKNRVKARFCSGVSGEMFKVR